MKGRLGRVASLLTWVALAAWPVAVFARDSPASVVSSSPVGAVEPIDVVAAGGVPFVMESESGELGGLSVEVWRLVAEQAQIPYSLERVESVEEALSRVARGGADVAIGPISITSSRAEKLSFTQPYFQAGLSVLSRAELSASTLLSPFFSAAFLKAMLALACALSAVGSALWWCERWENAEHFPRRPMTGVLAGVWCALVTMTTVGYGDVVPKTRKGKLLLGVWMLVAIVSLSSLTAGLASALTQARLETAKIETADGLTSRPVAAVKGSTGVAFARRYRARVTEVSDLERGVSLLRAGDVDAVVYDRPMLEYLLAEPSTSGLMISGRSYDRQGYGFASRPGEGPGKRINLALLRAADSGTLGAVVGRWFGDQ